MGMLPIYIGVDGEENQGLCTGSENYWCVNKNASEEDIQATLDFMKWVVESDEGRDMLANEMGLRSCRRLWNRYQYEPCTYTDRRWYCAGNGNDSV